MCCQCEADARFWFLSAEAIAISRPLMIPKEAFSIRRFQYLALRGERIHSNHAAVYCRAPLWRS